MSLNWLVQFDFPLMVHVGFKEDKWSFPRLSRGFSQWEDSISTHRKELGNDGPETCFVDVANPCFGSESSYT